MNYKRVALFIVVCYVVGFFLHALVLQKTVYGDGIYYFSWVRSLVVDNDVHFQNEYQQFNVTQPATATGLVTNKHSIGPALLWMPFFFWAHAILKSTGYTLPYQLIAGTASIFYALIGLLLLHRLLRMYFGTVASLCAVIAVAFATNLLFYGSLDTVNSHAVSFFAATLFLSFLFQKQKNWFLIGCSLGILSLIRLQDSAYALLLISLFKKHSRLLPNRGAVGVVRVILGFFLAFFPQLIAWQRLYGGFLMNPYINSYEGFAPLSPHILGVLFSPVNGLILWTPIVLIGFIGLLLKENRALPRRGMLLVFLTELFIVSSWSVWWQGASYSGRMFVSTLPLVGFGVAQVFAALGRLRWGWRHFLYIFLIPLSVINVIRMAYFLLSQ